MRDDIKAEIGPQPFQSLAIWRQVHLARAAVTVDPRFGVWDGLTGQVLPRGTSTKGVTLTPNTVAGSGGASASSTSDATAGAGTPTTVGPVPEPDDHHRLSARARHRRRRRRGTSGSAPARWS